MTVCIAYSCVQSKNMNTQTHFTRSKTSERTHYRDDGHIRVISFSGQMRGRRECIYRGNITAGLWVCVNTIACLTVSVWNWHFSHACSCSESLHGLTYFLFISLSSDLLLNKLWQPTYLLVISHDMETAGLILFDFFFYISGACHGNCVGRLVNIN